MNDPLGRDLMSGLGLNYGTNYQISAIDLAVLKDVGVPFAGAAAPAMNVLFRGSGLGVTTLHGSHDGYVVGNDNGSLYLQDTVGGRDGTQIQAANNVMTFTDGTGLFDPTGIAEDVDRLYSAPLGRTPDVSGLEFWSNTVNGSHVPLANVAGSFTSSLEFIQHYGALSDAAFVQQLYQNVLHRPGDAGGVQAWESALALGVSRGQVVLGFAESPENRVDTISTAGDKNDAEAYRLYQTALARAPDQAGQSSWSAVLADGTTPSQVAQAFISSAEFQQKYGALNISDLFLYYIRMC